LEEIMLNKLVCKHQFAYNLDSKKPWEHIYPTCIKCGYVDNKINLKLFSEKKKEEFEGKSNFDLD